METCVLCKQGPLRMLPVIEHIEVSTRFDKRAAKGSGGAKTKSIVELKKVFN